MISSDECRRLQETHVFYTQNGQQHAINEGKNFISTTETGDTTLTHNNVFCNGEPRRISPNNILTEQIMVVASYEIELRNTTLIMDGEIATDPFRHINFPSTGKGFEGTEHTYAWTNPTPSCKLEIISTIKARQQIYGDETYIIDTAKHYFIKIKPEHGVKNICNIRKGVMSVSGGGGPQIILIHTPPRYSDKHLDPP